MKMVIVPHLNFSEVVLVHCNIFNKKYQHSWVMCKFVPNRSIGSLLDILPKNFVFSSEFKPLVQSFYILKYGLLMKIPNRSS